MHQRRQNTLEPKQQPFVDANVFNKMLINPSDAKLRTKAKLLCLKI
jgi:hypothetical protein